MKPIMDLHNIDVAEFLAVLDTCEGNVYLVTNEGDKLNLRSKLCQLVGLTRLIEGGLQLLWRSRLQGQLSNGNVTAA